VTADAMYDATKIKKYNRRKRIKSNIPVNKINWKKKKRGRPNIIFRNCNVSNNN
jgi:hypothetical protein